MYNPQEKCEQLALKFKQICEIKGCTSYKLVKDTGVSSSTVNGFMKGKTKPRIDTLLILCNLLEITMSDFFEEGEAVERLTKEEEELLKIYRVLSQDKRARLNYYIKMLAQYKEENNFGDK